VLVSVDGQCKLADFGLSKMLTESGHPSQSGRFRQPIGTAFYMSPEQARGESSMPADIWSLGIVVCELCTGMTPWPGEGPGGGFIARLGHDHGWGLGVAFGVECVGFGSGIIGIFDILYGI